MVHQRIIHDIIGAQPACIARAAAPIGHDRAAVVEREHARHRQALVADGEQVGGVTLNRLCGSGMDAIGLAARSIKSGLIVKSKFCFTALTPGHLRHSVCQLVLSVPAITTVGLAAKTASQLTSGAMVLALLFHLVCIHPYPIYRFDKIHIILFFLHNFFIRNLFHYLNYLF